jgi:UDP-glucose 4-epimerase
MPITGRKFLITGGASLIASHLTRALLDAGASEVVLYDNLSLGSAALLGAFGPDARVRSIRGDVLRLPHLLDATTDATGIFALAGYLTLPFAENPAIGADVNVMGMINTLEAARLSSPCRVVFASVRAASTSAAVH